MAAYWVLEIQTSIKCLLSSLNLEPNNQNGHPLAYDTVSPVLNFEGFLKNLIHSYLFSHKISNTDFITSKFE